jgi:hypothetical protein
MPARISGLTRRLFFFDAVASVMALKVRHAVAAQGRSPGSQSNRGPRKPTLVHVAVIPGKAVVIHVALLPSGNIAVWYAGTVTSKPNRATRWRIHQHIARKAAQLADGRRSPTIRLDLSVPGKHFFPMARSSSSAPSADRLFRINTSQASPTRDPGLGRPRQLDAEPCCNPSTYAAQRRVLALSGAQNGANSNRIRGQNSAGGYGN